MTNKQCQSPTTEPVRKAISVNSTTCCDCGACYPDVLTADGSWVTLSKTYTPKGLDRDFPKGAIVVLEATNEYDPLYKDNDVQDKEQFRIWKVVKQ